jgi:hypothetical protein
MKTYIIPILSVAAMILAASLETSPAYAGYSCISYQGQYVCCYTYGNQTQCY